MSPVLVAVALLRHEGRLCCIRFKRNYLAGRWGLPGGKIDDGEFLPDAAAREILEEAGAQVRYHQLAGVVDELVTKPGGDQTRVVLFICDVQLTADPDMTDRDIPEGLIRWMTDEDIDICAGEFVPSDLQIIRRMAGDPRPAYWSSVLDVNAGADGLERFVREG